MYQCATEKCGNEADFDSHLCNDCINGKAPDNVLTFPGLEKAALDSTANFGEPTHFHCWNCRGNFTRDSFYNHLPCDEE